MKKQICFILLLINLVVGCKKEDAIPPSYLKASIDGKVFDGALLKFGRTISKSNLKANADTIFSVTGSLNETSLTISFPKPKKKSVFSIYCLADIGGKPSASCDVMPSVQVGGMSFKTDNIYKDSSIEGKLLGEIAIVEIDYRKRTIKGRFNFSAYGYKIGIEDISRTGETISIKDGEFYYHWDESLKL